MNKTIMIAIIVGLILGGLLLGTGVTNCIKINESVPISAYIEEIEVSYDTDGDIEHDVYVSFVNPDTNELQERRLSFYNSSMREGKELTLMYHSASGDIIDKGMSVVLIFVGALIMLVPIGIRIAVKRQQGY